MTYTLKDIRRDLKAMGYRLKTTRHSEFIGADVLDRDGRKINHSIAPAGHFEKHAEFYEYRKLIRGRAFEDDGPVALRVIL